METIGLPLAPIYIPTTIFRLNVSGSYFTTCSEATLLHRLASISTKIKPHTAYIRDELLKSAVVHSDETGMRIEDKTQWLHTVSISDWPLFMSMKNEGK